MFNDNDRINSKEAAFFIIATMIEMGAVINGRVLAKEAGPDGWLVKIIGDLLAVPVILIMAKLAQRFYKHGFVDYSKIIGGRVIGWILSGVMAVYWFIVTARVLNFTADIVRESLLQKTPILVISISFLILSVYICWYGIEPLCRLSIFITLVIVPLIILLSLAAISEFNPENFLPFMAKGPLPLLKLSLRGISDAEEMTFLLFIVVFMNKSKDTVKVALSSWVVLHLFGLIIIVMQIGVLGVELTKHQVIPGISFLDSAEIPGAFIEKLGLIFSALWIIIAFPTIAGLMYATSLTLSQMFGRKSHKLFLIPLVPLIYIVSVIPKNTLETTKFFKILTPLGFTALVGIPLFLYIIALIRRKKDS